MPIPRTALGDYIGSDPTMYDKLKSLERGMEPPPPGPIMPGWPQDMLRGMDNLMLFKEQLLQPPVDPDAQAMIGTQRRGLMPVSALAQLFGR